MSEITAQDLSGVTETLLVTLYLRALESQRPDALIKDEKAVALVAQLTSDASIRYDFNRIELLHLSEVNKLVIILRNRELDRYACDFLGRHPEAVVVHIGCGLDARFERVDNGQVIWYDLDLPEVVELRRKLLASASVLTGGSGAVRQSKDGVMISACSMSGDSSTNLSRG